MYINNIVKTMNLATIATDSSFIVVICSPKNRYFQNIAYIFLNDLLPVQHFAMGTDNTLSVDCKLLLGDTFAFLGDTQGAGLSHLKF